MYGGVEARGQPWGVGSILHLHVGSRINSGCQAAVANVLTNSARVVAPKCLLAPPPLKSAPAPTLSFTETAPQKFLDWRFCQGSPTSFFLLCLQFVLSDLLVNLFVYPLVILSQLQLSKDTNLRVKWEEGTSIEELTPTDWSVDSMSVGHFLNW